MWTLFFALLDETDAAGAAHADPHMEVLAPFNWLPGVTAWVVFLLAFGILAIKVWPKITGALDEREAKIRNEIKSAEEAREQAKRALSEYQDELANAREEANRMISAAREDAKRTAEELRRRNEEELSEMRARAQRDIQTAKASAISEIHSEAATLATSIASRILQREISVHDQQRLVEESLGQLSALKN